MTAVEQPRILWTGRGEFEVYLKNRIVAVEFVKNWHGRGEDGWICTALWDANYQTDLFETRNEAIVVAIRMMEDS